MCSLATRRQAQAAACGRAGVLGLGAGGGCQAGGSAAPARMLVFLHYEWLLQQHPVRFDAHPAKHLSQVGMCAHAHSAQEHRGAHAPD